MKEKINLKRKAIVIVIVAFTMMCFSQTTFAQDRWSIELRPGINIATKKLGEADLKTGFGGEGTVAFRFLPHLAVYAGWGWNKFGSDQQLNGTELEYEETGYTYGLQFTHPIKESRMSVMVRAGGLYNHIEVEEGNDINADSGHGFGWQVEGGLVMPLGEKLRVIPSVRFRSLGRDLTIEGVTKSVDLNYISAGLGLSFTF